MENEQEIGLSENSENPRPEIETLNEPIEERRIFGEKGSFIPTILSTRLRLENLHNGMMWGSIGKPLRFDFEADLPEGMLGGAEDRGEYILISVSSRVPEDLKDVIVCHELIEAEGLYYMVTTEESHPDACGIEEQYLQNFLSDEERARYKAIAGEPSQVKNQT